ncbi:hypothetical protein CFOL_v3_08508 [Cephalotus follicularis]|uniref:DUF7953 domain-containing protein n=1 Tax=Cephalotus follicularis TaxID=3775 RepID=A0A1Q3BB42_CEPFO|nr:hypothetical protein CFOL_v3_08508 [Cephalotus follicularis]
MPIRYHHSSRVLHAFLMFWIFLSCFPGYTLSAVVTLESIEIYRTHEWLKDPKVYFHCKDENRTRLPDVKKAHVVYAFNGQESWQPLTEFPGTKCKRCGLYEKDTIKTDDTFDEWEFCPSDFDADGKYNRVKAKEFNATFLCVQCVPKAAASNSANPAPDSHHGGKGVHVALVILISALVSTVMVVGVVMAFKYWQKKKRDQDQARFLKLFEDGDDVEDELGLDTVI